MNSLVLLPLCFAAAFAGVLPSAPLAYGHGHLAVAHHAVAPVAVGHASVARTQHHSQDAYSHTYKYGYAEPNSAKAETRHADGTVTGSYSVPLPDGRVLTNNYVADEHGFRSSLAPTAPKDFAPIVKAAYNVHAPVLAHSVHSVAVPQPALAVTKSVNYAAPALAWAGHNHVGAAPWALGPSGAAPLGLGLGLGLGLH